MTIDDYVPIPAWRAFHESTATHRAMIGGPGSGKTTAGCVEVIRAAREHPGCTVLVCRPRYFDLVFSTFPALLALLPPEEIAFETGINGRMENVRLLNGTTIHAVAVGEEHPAGVLPAVRADFTYIDCPGTMSALVWETLLTTTRGEKAGPRIWASDEPEEKDGRRFLPSWLWQRYYTFEAYQAATVDNPHLPRDFRERLEA